MVFLIGPNSVAVFPYPLRIAKDAPETLLVTVYFKWRATGKNLECK